MNLGQGSGPLAGEDRVDQLRQRLTVPRLPAREQLPQPAHTRKGKPSKRAIQYKERKRRSGRGVHDGEGIDVDTFIGLAAISASLVAVEQLRRLYATNEYREQLKQEAPLQLPLRGGCVPCREQCRGCPDG